MRPTWTQEDIRSRERELRSRVELRRRLRDRRKLDEGPSTSTRNPDNK